MKAKKSIRAIISIFLVLITLLSTFIPAVAAAENGIVEDFKVEFISGADNVDGKYVFDATKDNSGLRWNRFIYRVNYALSGEGMLQPGKVKITLPTSIITDRDGNIADEFDIAVPHADDVEETDNDVKFVYTVENDNTIVITNRLEISSAQAGNIEIAYIPTKSEINYVDMKKSADVTSTFTLGEGGAGYTRTSSADGVYFDTSVNNNYSSMACKNTTGGANDWNSSWGLEEPENSEQYTYVIWEIHTYLNNMTQYYDFEINDTMLPTDGEVLGYKFQNQTKYTTSNRVEKQNISQRYDYVLTKHLKTDVQQHGRVVPNYAETVVIPYDGVDEQTTANTSANFVYYISRNFDFNGQITSNKQGLNNESYVYDSNNISDFRLSEFKNGEINKIDNLTYECKFGEDGWNWDIDFDENGIKKSSGYYTTYTLEDKEIRVGSNVNEFVVGPQTATLQKESYDFNSLRITSFCNDIGFNNETKKIEPDSSKPINDIDYDVLVSVDGFDNYVKAATYHNKTKTWSDVDESIVTGTDNNGNIFFKDGVDAWEVTTTTNVFYLRYYVRSSITLNRTEEVLNYIGDSKLIPVNNRANYFVSYNEQDTDKKQMKTVDKHANVYVADPSILKKSSLSINAVKTLNNRIKRQYEASWNVKMLEYIDGVDSINQESGKFYILLPLGATLEKDSVAVKDGYGRIIPPGSFRYTVTPNYNNSGRILLTVDINKEGVNYTVDYKTLHSWSNLKDYGSMTYTSAAYETGNDEITNGYPDNGDSLIDNNYMADLDSETNDEKFIYTSRYYNVIAVTASSVGLTKLVQGSDDEKFSQSTNVHQNEVYTYQIRIANDYRTKSKDIILFDSIENFTKEGLQSDWRGTLQSVDITNLTEKDVAAVVYYSEIANLDISQHCDLTEQISGKKVWQTAEEIGDISNAKAIAIDCRKTVNGENFVLDKSQSIVVPVYLKSPAQVSETIENPETYNNIYLNETLIVEDGIETNDLVHYDYTAVGYRTVGNIEIRKVDSTDHEKLIEGVSFNLVGKSAYGTEYNLTSTTDSNGYICFNNIEKGEYTLTETEGVIDYLEDHNSIAVTIDNKGNVTVEGKEKEGNVYIIENKPRIHGNLSFTKVDKITSNKLDGVEFRLSGKSDYGNEILMYETSDANGNVNFYNIELGTYTLVETKYPDNYRNDGKKYTVVCDNSGILSIDVPLNSKGKYEIENEPYEEIKIYKVDADNPSLYLEGVQLRIHGTSDYGTEYDKTVTTNSNGVAAFGEMEIGKYILEEVQALENYKLDENKYVVTISANHTVTIEGLKKNNLGFWVFPNQRELNGKIKVTKVWKDNSDNETRKAPKVHIGLKEPERAVPTATFKPYFGLNFLRSAKTFSRDTSKSLSEVQDITGVIKVDDETTDKSIYIWEDTDNNGYWWSNAEIVYFPVNSNHIFEYCSNLQNLDLTPFDTSNVTNMSYMFIGCSSLTTLNLSNFDTSNVTEMDYMFRGCSSLTTLNLSNFDTSNVTSMYSMFTACSSLTTLNLSNFDTSNVTNMGYMFRDCSSLTTLNLSNFDTSNVAYIYNMFEYCSSLTALDVSNFDTSNVTEMHSMFKGCNSLTTLDVSNFDTSNVIDMSYMFDNCRSLTTLDVNNFDTSNVTNTQNMFYSCSSLTTLDVSNFDTSNVTDVQNMFYNCSSLTTLDVSNFNTSKAANTTNFLAGLINLKTLNISNSNLSALGEYNFKSAINELFDIEYIYANKADLSFITDMNEIFAYHYKLKLINLSYSNTSNVTDMSYMYAGCGYLQSVDMSGIDTSNVTDMSYMFDSCWSLTSLNLSGLDTSNVTNMTYMFNCNKNLKGNLSSLDLSGFDTSKVTDMSAMFRYQEKLETIYVSKSFNTNSVTRSSSMFHSCTSLIGGNGTAYDANHRNADYARIDTAETPGYFTYKEYSPSTPTEPSEPTEPVVKPPISAEYATLSKALFTETVELATSPRYWQKAYIQNFIHNTDKTLEEVEAIDGAVKVDNGATDKAIYIWADNYSNNTMKTVYWWSNASKVYLPANSSYLFTDFSALKNVDLADFDTSKVTVADSMFKGCKQIQTVGIGNWNTKKLTSAADMFANCYALTEPNVSNWKTPRLTNISGMFSGCGALSSLDLNGWNTKKLENINSTFSNCTKLSNLGIGNWNTQSLTDMGSAFGNCSKLNPINIGSWDVSKVTNLRETFNYCRAITSLDVSDWNTSSVTDMQGAFKGASSLTSLDLSGWDTSSVTNMREMFSGDTSLTTVYVSDLFNTDAVTDFNQMFYNAKDIVGGKGTTYDSSKINGEYANIDRTDDAGYLTLKDVLSRTYDSDDNGWTIVDDNTWTYTFDVFDDTAQYYIYEEDMEGYKSDTSYEAKKRLNDGDITNVITITNTADDVPDEPKITDFGSLTVTKTVHGDGLAVGEQGYIIGDFTFKLTLSGNDDITSGTKVWGDRVYENGVTTFKLHDRQSASFTGIPAGLNYTVTELNTEGYTVLTENSSGTITKDVNTTVSFVNNWQGDSRNKNSFSLVKRVINGEDNDVFNFTVFLTNLYPKLAYKLSDNTVYYSDSDGEATVNVQLKADDVITFQNLPVGSTYQITEKATPYYASYSVADELNLKMITSSSGSNTEVNKALSTGKENVEDNEKITVTFTNEKIITPVEPDPPAVKSVSVIKNWVNDNPTERPDSITVYLYQNEDLLKSAEITSTDNWRTTFDNLLVYDDFGKEYEYSVIEADVRGYVTDYTTSGNTYTITNTKVPVGNIEISNEIRGNAADFTKEFKYTVTLTDANGEPVTSSFERIGTKAGDMPFVNGVSTIYLTHHDDITIKDIPAGYHFKIVQTEDSLYTVTPDTATYEGVIIANDTIRNPYINELNAYGTLMVRKELESTRTEDRNLEFDFTVSIVKGNEKLSGTYECEGTSLSSITFNDGSANFKLKGGQTISIKDLPVGADYEVEEVGANSLDFLTYADNQKGVISKNSEENLVRFKNVRNVLPETGSYGNILLIGGSAFFLLLGFTVLLLRKREKNETK